MTKSFRALVPIVGIICSLSLAMATPTAAQTDDVDIDAIAGDVSAADPDALVEGLEAPMRDRDLPEGFSDAEFVDPADASTETGLIGGDDLEGSLGSVGYTLTGDPEIIDGENIIVSVQYVVFDEDEIGPDPLDDFITGAEGSLEDVDTGDGDVSVDTIEVNSVDAGLITYSQEDSSASAVAQYLVIPVGNVFVFTSLTVASTSAVDADDVYDFAEDLALSSITHLGEVAADA